MLIFLDLDGTFFVTFTPVSNLAKQAAAALRKKGHKLILCTGRSAGELPPEIKAMPWDGAVLSAGAYAQAEGKTLYEKGIPAETVRKTFELFEKHNVPCVLETQNEVLGKAYSLEYCREFFYGMQEKHGVSRSERNDLIEIMRECDRPWEETPARKILYYDSPITIPEVLAEIGGGAEIVPSAISDRSRETGEISPEGVDKSVGVRLISDYFGASKEDIIAIGDSVNDIPMLECAGLKIVMGNASDDVKALADQITDTAANDGFYKAFETLGMI